MTGPDAAALVASPSVTCTHRPEGARYQVIRSGERDEVRMECPCCHLNAWREMGDLEPMTCPYCGVLAVDTPDDVLCGVLECRNASASWTERGGMGRWPACGEHR